MYLLSQRTNLLHGKYEVDQLDFIIAFKNLCGEENFENGVPINVSKYHEAP